MGYIVLPYISYPQTTSTELGFFLKSQEVLIGNNLLNSHFCESFNLFANFLVKYCFKVV